MKTEKMNPENWLDHLNTWNDKELIREVLNDRRVDKMAIENDICGSHDYIEVPASESYKKATGRETTDNKVFIPFTDHSAWSNWKICLSVKDNNGYWVYAWCNAFSHEGEFHIHMDYIWTGTGKKMRRDGADNLWWLLRERAIKRLIKKSNK